MTIAPRSSLPPSVPALAARLARLLATGQGEPALVGVRDAGLGPPVVLPLHDRHPLEVLLGQRAPQRWQAVVVIASGTATTGCGHRRVVVASITSRQGDDRCLLFDSEGAVLLEAATGEGLIADAAQRFLDRPTAPPADPVWTWWAGAWLREVAEAGTAPMSLSQVASCHPAVDAEEVVAVVDGGADLVDFLIQRGLDHAHLTGWDGVRRTVASGLLDDPDCSAALACWFDAGAFCRYSGAVRPPLPALLDALAPVLPPEVRAQVRSVLDGWAGGRR